MSHKPELFFQILGEHGEFSTMSIPVPASDASIVSSTRLALAADARPLFLRLKDSRYLELVGSFRAHACRMLREFLSQGGDKGQSLVGVVVEAPWPLCSPEMLPEEMSPQLRKLMRDPNPMLFTGLRVEDPMPIRFPVFWARMFVDDKSVTVKVTNGFGSVELEHHLVNGLFPLHDPNTIITQWLVHVAESHAHMAHMLQVDRMHMVPLLSMTRFHVLFHFCETKLRKDAALGMMQLVSSN